MVFLFVRFYVCQTKYKGKYWKDSRKENMNEKIISLVSQIEKMEEELTDFAIQSLSEYLQSVEGAPNEEEMKKTKQLEKTISKVQRALQKAREVLGEL